MRFCCGLQKIEHVLRRIASIGLRWKKRSMFSRNFLPPTGPVLAWKKPVPIYGFNVFYRCTLIFKYVLNDFHVYVSIHSISGLSEDLGWSWLRVFFFWPMMAPWREASPTKTWRTTCSRTRCGKAWQLHDSPVGRVWSIGDHPIVLQRVGVMYWQWLLNIIGKT